MVVTQDTILSIIKQQGPLLPVQLAKAIGSDILIASAHLSNLTDKKLVIISNTKVGGSPVYYTEGQEEKLQNFLDNLNVKDQKTVQFLKAKKVLRDDKQEKLTRVSLRMVKDFAVPLQVTKGNEKILFWKWYLLSNNEAEKFIKNDLEDKEAALKKQEEQRKLEEAKKKAAEDKKIVEAEKKLAEKKAAEEGVLKKQEEQRKLEQKREEENKLFEKRKLEEKSKLEDERKKIEAERENFQKQIEAERQKMHKQMEIERQTLLKEIEAQKKQVKKPEVVKKVEEDPFLNHLNEYFKQKEIKLVEHKILRKKADIEMILKVPSVIGEIEYYCKAKNKKTISDTDLSSAVIQGQLKKLPVLFLGTGELTKKAKELLNTELRKGILVKKI